MCCKQSMTACGFCWTHSCLIELGNSCKTGNLSDKKKITVLYLNTPVCSLEDSEIVFNFCITFVSM